MTLVDHERYMRRAIELGRTISRLPFGAVIVDGQSGVILGEGWNRTDESPIWPGEMAAIENVSKQHCKGDWRHLLLYTTAEPCAMCQGAIGWAGIGTVIFGSSIGFLMHKGWWQINISAAEIASRTPFSACQIIGGVLEMECNQLFLEAAGI